jgi:hypothetical protein
MEYVLGKLKPLNWYHIYGRVIFYFIEGIRFRLSIQYLRYKIFIQGIEIKNYFIK